MFEVKLLIQNFKSLRDEVIFKPLNSCHQILFQFILPFHECFLSSIHRLNDWDLFSHSFLNFLHSFTINCVSVFQVLCCSQMNLIILLNVLNASYLSKNIFKKTLLLTILLLRLNSKSTILFSSNLVIAYLTSLIMSIEASYCFCKLADDKGAWYSLSFWISLFILVISC